MHHACVNGGGGGDEIAPGAWSPFFAERGASEHLVTTIVKSFSIENEDPDNYLCGVW